MRPEQDSSARNLLDSHVVSSMRPSGLRALHRLACVTLVWAVGACASAAPRRVETVRRMSPSEEAEAIEAAKRHPIALTYDRPRPAEALPVRPAPIPAEPAAVSPAPAAEAPPSAAPTQAPPPPRDQVVVVGQDPPSTVTTYTWPETDRDDRYHWVDGGWVERPRYRAYIDGRPYGWGGYVGWYQPRPWLSPPPVVVVPGHSHWHHHHRHSHHPRYVAPAPRYRTPRRDVYVAPPARSQSVRPAPVYRAPAARPAPRGEVRSAPSSRRAIRVR